MKILKIWGFNKSIIHPLKCICVFLVSSLTVAQSNYLNLDVENDLYFLTDQYYSSGIFIETGKVVEKDSVKKFKIWELGQEIFKLKPKDIEVINPNSSEFNLTNLNSCKKQIFDF